MVGCSAEDVYAQQQKAEQLAERTKMVAELSARQTTNYPKEHWRAEASYQ